jgi:23S rRNA (uridine2552-2'-O)-methyltransferase
MAYQRKDTWYHKAKNEGYRSRAAYKLQELHQRLKLFKSGILVIDLGCAPGGWLQVAAKLVGGKGRIVGIDRNATKTLEDSRISTLTGDITQSEVIDSLYHHLGKKADLILSDMAPDTTGVGFQDHVHSVELVKITMQTAIRMLASGGNMVAKVFDGSDLTELVNELSRHFNRVKRIRLKTTRKGSRELYLFAANFKGPCEKKRG